MVIFVDIEDTADMTGHIGLVILIWSYRLIDQFVFAMLKMIRPWPKAGRVHRQASSACRTSILSSTQYVHASSLTTWENACDCKRARVQPGYADADVRCACADETFAADLICSFPGQAVGCESSEHSSTRNVVHKGLLHGT